MTTPSRLRFKQLCVLHTRLLEKRKEACQYHPDMLSGYRKRLRKLSERTLDSICYK